MVWSVARRASNDRGGAASMISLFPSLRMMAIVFRQLEFAQNPDCLISPILEQFDVSLGNHDTAVPRWPSPG